MRSLFFWAWFLVFQVSAISALAWPPTYGLEFNLKSRALDQAWSDRMKKHGDSYQGQAPSADGEHRIASELVEKIRAACAPECTVESQTGKFGFKEWNFKFSNGFSFNVSVDPATVEMQLGPWDLETWKKHGQLIQKWLFDLPKQHGFTYAESGFQENSAHLNIGFKSAFDQDAKSFARYLADYWQYPELGSGILGDDAYNAPMLGDLDADQQEAAKALLESVNSNKKMTAVELAKEVEKKIYTKSPSHKDGGYHYQSIGLKYVTETRSLVNDSPLKDVPFEIRANRQPLSAEAAVLQLELQNKRLEYLRSRSSEPVELDLKLVSPGRKFSNGKSGQDRLTAFYLYLADMGLEKDFEKYRAIVDPDLKKMKPHAFVTGKIDWKNAREVAALEKFAPRARQSSGMREILRKILLTPGASESAAAKRILSKMGDLALGTESFFMDAEGLQKAMHPASESLFQACLDVTTAPGWRDVPEFQELRTKIQGKTPQQMKNVKGFWSACRSMFGAFATP